MATFESNTTATHAYYAKRSKTDIIFKIKILQDDLVKRMAAHAPTMIPEDLMRQQSNDDLATYAMALHKVLEIFDLFVERLVENTVAEMLKAFVGDGRSIFKHIGGKAVYGTTTGRWVGPKLPLGTMGETIPKNDIMSESDEEECR